MPGGQGGCWEDINASLTIALNYSVIIDQILFIRDVLLVLLILWKTAPPATQPTH